MRAPELTCWSCDKRRVRPIPFGAHKLWCQDGYTDDHGFPFRRLSECPNASYEPGSDEAEREVNK